MAPSTSRLTGCAMHGPLLALLAGVALTLQGCGSSNGPAPSPAPATTTVPPTPSTTSTTTTTTTTLVIPGECSASQRKNKCAFGFCNDTICDCIPNYEKETNTCAKASGQKNMTFYMYRAQDDTEYDVSNDNLASLSGVMWYMHNEVVVQSCPRLRNIVRIKRILVTVRNTDAMFAVRQSLFGPLAIFSQGSCGEVGCQKDIFDQYGYVVGCAQPGASTPYDYGGYLPIWYSLPGKCPEKEIGHKDVICKNRHRGGECAVGPPDGSTTCTYTFEEAGSINVDELYGPGFDYAAFCAKGGKEYRVSEDQGTEGVNFWDNKKEPSANAKRVQALRELFAAKYPNATELPEPWCDWQNPDGPTSDALEVNI